jgi:hypothetical protein
MGTSLAHSPGRAIFDRTGRCYNGRMNRARNSMRSAFHRLTTALVSGCLVANWAAQAQETRQGLAGLFSTPSDQGIGAIGNGVDLLPGPNSGPAIGSASSLPRASVNFADQFTLSRAHPNVTIGNSRSSGNVTSAGLSSDKSCLVAKAYMRTDFGNKNLHQNWINAKNDCDHYIKISVCYQGTASCTVIDVPAWQTKTAIIGYATLASEVHYHISVQDRY